MICSDERVFSYSERTSCTTDLIDLGRLPPRRVESLFLCLISAMKLATTDSLSDSVAELSLTEDLFCEEVLLTG